VGCPLDRARHKLGEETHEQRERNKIAGRLQFSPVNVDGIRHCLERVERDPHGKNHLHRVDIRLYPENITKVEKRLEKESVVFEKAKNPKITGEANQKEDPALVSGNSGKVPAHRVVQNRGEKEKTAEPPVPPSVEKVARHQQKDILPTPR